MKYICLLALVATTNAINMSTHSHAHARDEVDDLLEKQDQKDAQEVLDKEFNDANSKMNQIGSNSRKHASAEDDDFMKSVFDQYATAGKDKRGNPTGFDIMTKEKAYEAAKDIIMKWNDLPEMNAKKYLDDKFEKQWTKTDVNNQGFIDETEAFQFTRQLMGTFTSLTDGIDTSALNDSSDVQVDEILQAI